MEIQNYQSCAGERGGRDNKCQKAAAEIRASCKDTTYFTENSLKMIHNFTEKRGVRGPLDNPLNPPMF